MKKLVVNADDFGISEGVNRGIVEGFEAGIVRSASLMANLEAFESAVATARKHPDLGVGVHLNVTCGRPVSAAKGTLTGPEGGFHPLPRLIVQLMAGRIDLDEAENEWDAQIEKVRKAGLQPTHLDSHQHVHFFPSLGRIIRKLARKHTIPWVRGSSLSFLRGLYWHPSMVGRAGTYSGFFKVAVLSNLRRLQNGRNGGGETRRTDRMLGISYIPPSRYQEAVGHFIKTAAEGLSELVCHPGYVDEELRRNDRWTHMREEELRALTSPRTLAAVRETGVSLASFRDAFS